MRINNNQRIVGEGAIFTVGDSIVGMSTYHFAFKIRYRIHEKLGPFPICFFIHLTQAVSTVVLSVINC